MEHRFSPLDLLRSAQMCAPLGSNSFLVPMGTILCKEGVPERAEILNLFRTEREVRTADFTMRYNWPCDAILFNRISPLPAQPPTQVAAQPEPVSAVTHTQKMDSMSAEQIAEIARAEWARDLKLHREFTGEAAYVAWRRAEFSGRARIFGRQRTHE